MGVKNRSKKAAPQQEVKFDEEIMEEEKPEMKMDVSLTSETSSEELREQAIAALSALQEWNNGPQGKKALFSEEAGAINLQIIRKKPPRNLGLSIHKVSFPHAWRTTETTSVCLFVKDLNRDRFHADVDKDARAFSEFLTMHKGLPSGLVREIISLRQLKREYKTFEAKRRLATAHDLFLVDDRVLREVHRNLGKEFQAKTK